ncbi:MAG: PaaI family thioesterase [Hyphomicrobiaceae bacterium]|nr:MAG: PaaI family thioesterase [Hyphomicrobiaceae bacterium]
MQLNADTIHAMLKRSPFISFLNLEVVHVDIEKLEIGMRLPMRPELERGGGSGQFHGGPIASFIDTVGDYAVVLAVKGPVPTINLRVDYLRPCTGQHIDAVARARRVGKSIAVVDIDVVDSEGRLCAIGRGSYGVPGG